MEEKWYVTIDEEEQTVTISKKGDHEWVGDRYELARMLAPLYPHYNFLIYEEEYDPEAEAVCGFLNMYAIEPRSGMMEPIGYDGFEDLFPSKEAYRLWLESQD